MRRSKPLKDPGGVLLKRVDQQPSLIEIDGAWLHHGIAEPGANWERAVEDVQEERMQSLLNA
jgi:hypothetical protein